MIKFDTFVYPSAVGGCTAISSRRPNSCDQHCKRLGRAVAILPLLVSSSKVFGGTLCIMHHSDDHALGAGRTFAGTPTGTVPRTRIDRRHDLASAAAFDGSGCKVSLELLLVVEQRRGERGFRSRAFSRRVGSQLSLLSVLLSCQRRGTARHDLGLILVVL